MPPLKFATPLFLLAVALSGLSGCAPLATIDDHDPRLPATLATEQDPDLILARFQAQIALDLIDSNEDPTKAIVESSEAARLSLQALKHDTGPEAIEAQKLYNFSVARLMEAIFQSDSTPWIKPLNLTTPSGPLVLRVVPGPHEIWNPAQDKLAAVDRWKVGGYYFKKPAVLDGIGAPFVSHGPPLKVPFAPTYHYCATTAVASFSGNKETVNLDCPYFTSEVNLDGTERPLAANFAASIAKNVKDTHPAWLGFWALLYPSKYIKDSRLVMREPYHPGLQPIVLVHGLMDSPVSWVPQINAFNANPELRKHYQIWYFQYSSALPFPMSAELLRENLDAIYTKYPHTPKAILVGHSMGGLLSQLMMCDSGTEFSRDVVGKPVSELNLEPSATLVAGALQFHESTHIAKVIFEATPHRGANMAANAIGRFGTMLVRLPESMISLGASVLAQKKSEAVVNRIQNSDTSVVLVLHNSIATLCPESLSILAMNKLKMDPNIPYYSIIGNWTGTKDILHSSDAVVPYTSAHMPGAQSEKIVTALHSELIYQPETIAEVNRILLDNLKDPVREKSHSFLPPPLSGGLPLTETKNAPPIASPIP